MSVEAQRDQVPDYRGPLPDVFNCQSGTWPACTRVSPCSLYGAVRWETLGTRLTCKHTLMSAKIRPHDISVLAISEISHERLTYRYKDSWTWVCHENWYNFVALWLAVLVWVCPVFYISFLIQVPRDCHINSCFWNENINWFLTLPLLKKDNIRCSVQILFEWTLDYE